MLRVAAVRECDYEWAQHVVLAGDAGLTADEIEHVADGSRRAAAGSPSRPRCCRAVDELLARRRDQRRHLGGAGHRARRRSS